MSFDIHIDGIEELERDFHRIESTFAIASQLAAVAGAREGLAEAKANHVYTDRTGELTNTAYSGLESASPIGAVAFVKWPKHYASYVENGTAPHLIVGNPWLRFTWHGVPVSFRYVNHPGSRPHPFAGIAWQKAERVIYRELELGVFKGQQILDAA